MPTLQPNAPTVPPRLAELVREKPVPPPATLSGLLRLAIDDAAHCAAAGVSLYMDSWACEQPEYCSVCLAGAVLVRNIPELQRLQFGYNALDPDDVRTVAVMFGRGDWNRSHMYALDDIRRGVIDEAIREFYRPTDFNRETFEWSDRTATAFRMFAEPEDYPSYVASPAAWLDALRGVADRLEAAGL